MWVLEMELGSLCLPPKLFTQPASLGFPSKAGELSFDANGTFWGKEKPGSFKMMEHGKQTPTF